MHNCTLHCAYQLVEGQSKSRLISIVWLATLSFCDSSLSLTALTNQWLMHWLMFASSLYWIWGWGSRNSLFLILFVVEYWVLITNFSCLICPNFMCGLRATSPCLLSFLSNMTRTQWPLVPYITAPHVFYKSPSTPNDMWNHSPLSQKTLSLSLSHIEWYWFEEKKRHSNWY